MGKLIGYTKIQTETLEKRRSSSQSTRNPTGWILRSVSVFFIVQPSKTGILGLEIRSQNPKILSPIIVGLKNRTIKRFCGQTSWSYVLILIGHGKNATVKKVKNLTLIFLATNFLELVWVDFCSSGRVIVLR